MKFLADENVPQGVIRKLRKIGYEVEDIKKTTRSLTDLQIIKTARDTIILTFDKDFLKDKHLRVGKVIIFDFPGEKSIVAADYVVSLVRQLDDLQLPEVYILMVRETGLVLQEIGS